MRPLLKNFALSVPFFLLCFQISGGAQPVTGAAPEKRVDTDKPLFRPLPLKLPSKPARAAVTALRGAQVDELRRQAKTGGVDAQIRLAKYYEEKGFQGEAAAILRTAANTLRSKKYGDLAVIQDNRAASLESDIRLFADVKMSAKAAGDLYTGAIAEPVLGCYSGAFIDLDDSLGKYYVDENWQRHRKPAQFETAMGRTLGSMFMYLKYSPRNQIKFPAVWLNICKENNIVPHIALEPENLNDVQDDHYLQEFGLKLREYDWPVMIRFASEMNGEWTPYHGNPALYKEKFRLLHKALRRYAPRVATIWCVNNPPLGNAFDYYPGDDACDWVGVNFYAVPFLENDPKRPALNFNTLTLLDPIYQRFAKTKPIAICEFAASHQYKADGEPILEFAREKLSTVYGAIPLLYPRVKMISWFSTNTFKLKKGGITKAVYTLKAVKDAWRWETGHPYFLHGRERLGDPLPPVARPLQGLKVSPNPMLRIWGRTYSSSPRVYLDIDGRIVYAGEKVGAHSFEPKDLAPGNHTATAYLYDNRGAFIKKVSASFQVVGGIE